MDLKNKNFNSEPPKKYIKRGNFNSESLKKYIKRKIFNSESLYKSIKSKIFIDLSEGEVEELLKRLYKFEESFK